VTQLRTLRSDCSQVDGERMARFVDSDVATAGQPEAGQPSLPLLGDLLGEVDSLRLQIPHRCFDVVAHEVELVPGGTVGGVHGQLRGRQLEDQPATTSVDVRVSENVSDEGAIRFRITAEHDDVAAPNRVLTPTRLDAGSPTRGSPAFADLQCDAEDRSSLSQPCYSSVAFGGAPPKKAASTVDGHRHSSRPPSGPVLKP